MWPIIVCAIALAIGAVLWNLAATLLRGRTDLSGKCVLVTGGASGIGLEMCTLLLQKGASVIVLDLSDRALDSAKASLSKVAGEERVSTYVCDVSAPAVVAAVCTAIKEKHRVDILINNAGVVTGKPFENITERDLQKTFGVNVFAHYYVTQQFLNDFSKRNTGHIVTIASTMGLFGAVNLSDYCGSKHAAVGVHECLRLELRRRRSNIRTLLVCPNAINTGMFKGISLGLQWLVPILDSKFVASEVVRAIESNRESIVLPWTVSVNVPLAKLMPRIVRDFVMDLFGQSSGMDTFAGKRA